MELTQEYKYNDEELTASQIEVLDKFCEDFKTYCPNLKLTIKFDYLQASPGMIERDAETTYSRGCYSWKVVGSTIILNLNKISNDQDLAFVLYHELGHLKGNSLNSSPKSKSKIIKTVDYIALLLTGVTIIFFPLTLGILLIGVLNYLIARWKIKTLAQDRVYYNYLIEYGADLFAYNILKNQPEFKIENTLLNNPAIAVQKESHPSGQMRMEFLKTGKIPYCNIPQKLFSDSFVLGLITIYKPSLGKRLEKTQYYWFLMINQWFK